MWSQAAKFKILPLNLWGGILGGAFRGRAQHFWDPQSFYLRQQVQVWSEKHDHQGQVERFCKVLPLAVTLGTSPTKLMERVLWWNLDFLPILTMSHQVDRRGKNCFDPGGWHLWILFHFSLVNIKQIWTRVGAFDGLCLKLAFSSYFQGGAYGDIFYDRQGKNKYWIFFGIKLSFKIQSHIMCKPLHLPTRGQRTLNMAIFGYIPLYPP